MIKEIIIGAIGSIMGAIITLVVTKLFWGFKHFKGVKNVARLNQDCYKAGIINVFPNREAYIEHWNCQHPSSQKTPKILTAADQAARTESMLLSR